MSKSNDRNGRPGRRSKDRQRPQSESPLDHEPFAANVERSQRLLAELIAIAWWRQGLGFGAIATRLNKLGVPSPDAGQTRTEKGVTHALSVQWQVNTVKNILLNPLIAGRQRPKKVDRYALGKWVYDQTDGCGYPLYGKMRTRAGGT